MAGMFVTPPALCQRTKMQTNRLLLLLLVFFFSCLSFGQDSLLVDTTEKTITLTVQDTVTTDSNSSALNDPALKNNKPKKKIRKKKKQADPVVRKEEDTEAVDAKGNDDRAIAMLTVLLIITAIIGFSFSFWLFGKPDKPSITSPKDEDFMSDYLSRMLMSRRDYYNNVYLKSEAWKRKRYVVLKRDNWRCVYCGRQATQVHHTRYAKRNIGKEPIEWLVSICRSCHESKH